MALHHKKSQTINNNKNKKLFFVLCHFQYILYIFNLYLKLVCNMCDYVIKYGVQIRGGADTSRHRFKIFVGGIDQTWPFLTSC